MRKITLIFSKNTTMTLENNSMIKINSKETKTKNINKTNTKRGIQTNKTTNKSMMILMIKCKWRYKKSEGDKSMKDLKKWKLVINYITFNLKKYIIILKIHIIIRIYI